MAGKAGVADFDWSGLPEGLRYGLLVGGEGKPHLAGLARRALARPETMRLGLDLLLAAWEAGPLDGGLALTLLALDGQAGFLSRAQREVIGAVAANWAQPLDAAHLEIVSALAARREHDALLTWLFRRGLAEPGNLFWRQHLLDTAYLLADWSVVERALALPWPEGTGEIQTKIRADAAYQQGDFTAALAGYEVAGTLRIALSRAAAALAALGRTEDAVKALGRARARSPWNVNLVLRQHDLRFLPGPYGISVQPNSPGTSDQAHQADLADASCRSGPATRPEDGPRIQEGKGDPRQGRSPGQTLGRVAVCLYTAGKAREIDATLAALAASELSGARVVVLDNGSRDDTPQVLAAWQERLGQSMVVVTLPVNIGAPAARNWLMGHAAVADTDFVAYLDDDALVPPDWLARLAVAVRAYPRAGVWGCKVADLPVPARMQNIDIHFLEDLGDTPTFSSLCAQDLDFGQFDYLRPCLSVTGCCHLFRTRELTASGGFDIRFSPTQYDDCDHDLRLAASGRPPVYQGHLRVGHARLSGALLHLDPAATANSQGNLKKLVGKHPAEERERLRLLDGERMLDDLVRKLERLREAENGAGEGGCKQLGPKGATS